MTKSANIKLKPYQQKAVDQLTQSIEGLLNKQADKLITVFQAPTGSGKTLMTAKVIEELTTSESKHDLCFLWITIGKGELHIQSKEALEKIFKGFPRVTLVEEEYIGTKDQINPNEVVVVNWEKLRSKDRASGEWKNTLMKDGEKRNFLEVLQNTRKHRKIILIIDESHIGATSERTNELRNEIEASVILEMSATPRLKPDLSEVAKGNAGFVFVDPTDVISEGMIKKELIINKDIDKIADSDLESQDVILEAAFQKREELKKLYEAENSKINPLVLIQLPTSTEGEEKLKNIKAFLFKKGLQEQIDKSGNGKFAIWLSDQKSENLEWISEPENEIEFLAFKQAIDTGWDCPRAQILVKLRESHSETFEIQTVGRILRMPEQKHYISDELNTGYIYTNVQSIIVKKEEYNPNIIKQLKATRREIYTPTLLTSFYRSRVDYGDITSSFTQVFDDEISKKIKLDEFDYNSNIELLKKHGILIDIKKYQQELLLNASLGSSSFDELSGQINSPEHAKLALAALDIQHLFDNFIKSNLGSFKNIKRSLPAVKSSIYSWFRRYLGTTNWNQEALTIQSIVISDSNLPMFTNILSSAIDTYKVIKESEVEAKATASEVTYQYEPTPTLFHNQFTDELFDSKKYLYTPCYLDIGRLAPERRFESFLEKNESDIVWWLKNGESKKEFFGIRYEYPKGVTHTFYPDYLVKTPKHLYILEVKHESDQDGSTYTKSKAEALQELIKNSGDQTIKGGIVVEHNNKMLVNSQPNYDWEKRLKNDWSDWVDLKLLD